MNLIIRSGLVLVAAVFGIVHQDAQAEDFLITAISNEAFSVSELVINQGDTVTFRNDHRGFHNVVAEWADTNERIFRCAQGCDSSGGNGDPDTGLWEFSWTFDEPGEVFFYCQPHVGQGMVGTITVIPAGNGGSFPINYGHNGSWYNPATNGQGFLFDILVDDMGDAETMVAYVFTYDLGAGMAKFEGEEQRWFVAAGPITGDTAEMTLTLTTGGVFDDPAATDTVVVGSMRFISQGCLEGLVEIDINQNVDEDDMLFTEIPVVRLSPDVLCEALADPD